MSDANTKPKPPSSDVPRPNTVTYTALALGITGVSAILAALTLFGVKPWIEQSAKDSNAKLKNPVQRTETQWHDHISQVVVSQLVANVVLALALAFVAFGVLRGRPWSRWGTVGVWALSTFTGTLAGLTSVFAVSMSAPGPFKAATFVAGTAMLAAVVLVNLRPSVQYFNAHKPVLPEGVAPRPGLRDLFAGRAAAGRAAGGAAGGAATSRPAAKADAAPKPTAAKAKAKARSDDAAVAKGAELARSRARASKSRRTE